MKKFKYCITSLYTNDTVGTDDQDAASMYSMDEEHIVIDMTTCQLLVEGELTNIKQLDEEDSYPETEDIDKG